MSLIEDGDHFPDVSPKPETRGIRESESHRTGPEGGPPKYFRQEIKTVSVG